MTTPTDPQEQQTGLKALLSKFPRKFLIAAGIIVVIAILANLLGLSPQ